MQKNVRLNLSDRPKTHFGILTMAFRSYGSRRQGNTGSGTKSRRRRNTLRSRVRWQKPSARNQKKQLSSLTKIALRNAKMLSAQRTFCDWVLTGTRQFSTATSVITLMSVDSWNATMRQNLDVVTQQRTYIRNMSLSWYLDGAALNNDAQVTMFLVSLRSTAANWDGTLTENTEWCNQGAKNAVMLNPNIFKVHWTRHFNVFPEQFTTADGSARPSGNPSCEYRRGRINIKSKYSIMAPAGQTWKQMTSDQLTPHRRLFFLIFPQTDNPQSTLMTFNFGLKATTVNAD